MVKIGFKASGRVFSEHLREEGVDRKLRGRLAEYLGRDPAEVSFEHGLVEGEGFKTLADLGRERDEERERERKEEVLRDPVIRKAEEIFSGKVDMVRTGAPGGG